MPGLFMQNYATNSNRPKPISVVRFAAALVTNEENADPSSRKGIRDDNVVQRLRRPMRNLSKQRRLRATSSPQLHQSPGRGLRASRNVPPRGPQIPARPQPKVLPKSADQKTNSGNLRQPNPQIPRTRERTLRYFATRQTKIQPVPHPRPHPNIPLANDPSAKKRHSRWPSPANVPTIQIP